MVHTLNPALWQRQVDLCEFEASLVYRKSFRTARDTQRNPDLFIFFKDVFDLYEYTVAVFRHTRRGHWVPLQTFVSHHVVTGN